MNNSIRYLIVILSCITFSMILWQTITTRITEPKEATKGELNGVSIGVLVFAFLVSVAMALKGNDINAITSCFTVSIIYIFIYIYNTHYESPNVDMRIKHTRLASLFAYTAFVPYLIIYGMYQNANEYKIIIN
jgi:hypothetical protein